jgi:hypothetical protein
MTIISYKKKSVEKCKLCERTLDEEYSELAYEILNEDGTTKEKIVVGKICKTCADTLDNQDELLDLDD